MQELELVNIMMQKHQRTFTVYTPEMSVTNHLPTREKHLKNMAISDHLRLLDRFYFLNRQNGYYALLGFGRSTSCSDISSFFLKLYASLLSFEMNFKRMWTVNLDRAERASILLPNDVGQLERSIYRDKSKHEVPLSEMEFRCLEKISFNKTIKEAARELGLSPRTVETYLNRIRAKTGARSKAELGLLLHAN